MHHGLASTFVVGAAAAFAFLTPPGRASAAVLADDDFDYPTPGDLAGNGGWGFVGTATGAGNIDPTVGSGSLADPDRPAGFGNKVFLDGTSPAGVAKLTTMADQALASGTVFYSMQLTVTSNAGNLSNTTGSFIAGYSINDTLAPGATSVATAAGALMIHRDPLDTNFYNLGIGVTENTADRQFDAAPLAANTPYFVVVGYEFGAGTDDDVARIWINPAPGTYGAAVAPTGVDADLNYEDSTGADNITATDRATLASFFLRNNSTAPDGIEIDDLLIGNTWAEVTAVPEPGAAVLASLALALAGCRRRS